MLHKMDWRIYYNNTSFGFAGGKDDVNARKVSYEKEDNNLNYNENTLANIPDFCARRRDFT